MRAFFPLAAGFFDIKQRRIGDFQTGRAARFFPLGTVFTVHRGHFVSNAPRREKDLLQQRDRITKHRGQVRGGGRPSRIAYQNHVNGVRDGDGAGEEQSPPRHCRRGAQQPGGLYSGRSKRTGWRATLNHMSVAQINLEWYCWDDGGPHQVDERGLLPVSNFWWSAYSLETQGS